MDIILCTVCGQYPPLASCTYWRYRASAPHNPHIENRLTHTDSSSEAGMGVPIGSHGTTPVRIVGNPSVADVKIVWL